MIKLHFIRMNRYSWVWYCKKFCRESAKLNIIDAFCKPRKCLYVTQTPSFLKIIGTIKIACMEKEKEGTNNLNNVWRVKEEEILALDFWNTNFLSPDIKVVKIWRKFGSYLLLAKPLFFLFVLLEWFLHYIFSPNSISLWAQKKIY